MSRLADFVRLLATALLLSLAGCTASAVQPGSDAAKPQVEPAAPAVAPRVSPDEQLDALFGMLRKSLQAAADGKPAPDLSPEEKAKLEAAGRAMRRESIDAAMRMLDQAEKDAREMLHQELQGGGTPGK